jgi:hypothetical protein
MFTATNTNDNASSLPSSLLITNIASLIQLVNDHAQFHECFPGNGGIGRARLPSSSSSKATTVASSTPSVSSMTSTPTTESTTSENNDNGKSQSTSSKVLPASLPSSMSKQSNGSNSTKYIPDTDMHHDNEHATRALLIFAFLFIPIVTAFAYLS